jgi:hypothetical protein
MEILLFTLLGIGLSVCVVFLLTRDTDSNIKLEEGNFYTCGVNGCKPSRTGEHRTESACMNSCRSYVKRNGNCSEVSGIPWDSFIDLRTCHRDTM